MTECGEGRGARLRELGLLKPVYNEEVGHDEVANEEKPRTPKTGSKSREDRSTSAHRRLPTPTLPLSDLGRSATAGQLPSVMGGCSDPELFIVVYIDNQL